MRKARGFTLLETVIAMVIMAGGLLLLTNSWGGSFMRVRKTQQAFEIAALLERKMNDVELEFRGKPLEEIPEEKEGDFTDLYPQYTWKLSSKKMEFPDLTSALVGQDGGASQTLIGIIKQLTDTLGKSIKEVTVTVIFSGGVKPLEYSVTTYFVDYDKDMQAAMPGGMGGGMPGGVGQ